MTRAERVPPTVDRASAPTLTRRLVELHRSDPSAARGMLRALLGALPLASSDAAATAEAVLTAALESSIALDPERAAHGVGIACSLVSPHPDIAPAPPRGDEPAAIGRTAAALALAGVDAPATAIEGRHGLLAVLGAEQPTVLAADPGSMLRPSAPAGGSPLDGHSITAELAAWAASAGSSELPAAARTAARTMVGNIGALIIAAMRTPTLRRLVAELPVTEDDALPVLAPTGPRPAADVALLYGIAAHLEDFDDTHLASVTHPGSCAVPAALALWPAVRPSGDALLAAVAVGAEVAIRLGERLEPALQRGWHISALVAPIASAAVAGRLLGLDEHRLAAAMGAAATRASGLTEALGTLTKPVHLGHGASVGVRAALQASRGPIASAAIDPLGRLVAALRGYVGPRRHEAWLVEHNRVKPYACGVLGHAAIDLASALRSRIAGREPLELELRVSPLAVQAMGRTAPTAELEAKFSLSHAVAVGLARGTADPVDFTQAAIDEAVVRRARERVRVVADDRLARFEARLVAVWPGGDEELHANGPRALDAAGVHAKVLRLLEPALGARAEVLANLLLTDDLASFGRLWLEAATDHSTAEPTTRSEALQ